MFAAAIEVAGDRSATPQARVYALRVLVWALNPGGWISYADLAGTGQSDRRVCLRYGTPFHTQIVSGEPLPGDYVERVHRLAASILDDASEPVTVRSAAFCATYPAATDK
jgi:hypothetical protein